MEQRHMAMAKKSNSSKHKKAVKKMLSYLLRTFNLGFKYLREF
jgi:hypothetical protein